MSLTANKQFTLGIFLSLIIGFMVFLGSPINAHAEDPVSKEGVGDVKVTVGTDGKLGVSGGSFTNAGSAGAWNSLIGKYQKFIVGISGIGAVTMIALFIIAFMKLGASAGNPQARSQALTGVLWTGIAAAGLGAVTIIVGFFYNSIS